MGEGKVVICRDCKEYVDIQKPYFPHYRITNDTGDWFEEAFRNEWKREYLKRMMAFMDKHAGCNISLLGEYGGTQDRYFEVYRKDEYEEFELGYD